MKFFSFFFLLLILIIPVYANQEILTCEIYKTSFFDKLFDPASSYKAYNYDICQEIIKSNQTDAEKTQDILDLLDTDDSASQKIVDDFNSRKLEDYQLYINQFGIQTANSDYIKNVTFKIIDLNPSIEIENSIIIPYNVTVRSVYNYTYVLPKDYEAETYPTTNQGYCKINYFIDELYHQYDFFVNDELIMSIYDQNQEISFADQQGQKEINGIFRVSLKGHKDEYTWRTECSSHNDQGDCTNYQHYCDQKITNQIVDSVVLTSNFNATIENIHLNINPKIVGDNKDIQYEFSVDYENFREFDIGDFFKYDGYEAHYALKYGNYIQKTAYPIKKVGVQKNRVDHAENSTDFKIKIHGLQSETIKAKGFFYDIEQTLEFPKKKYTESNALFGAKVYTIHDHFTIMPLIYDEEGNNITGKDISLIVKYDGKTYNTYSGDIIQIPFTNKSISNQAKLEMIFKGNDKYFPSSSQIEIRRWGVWLDAIWSYKSGIINLLLAWYITKLLISILLSALFHRSGRNLFHPYKF